MLGRYWRRSNLCPDEKGTESVSRIILPTVLLQVATYAPMKRGLKAVAGSGKTKLANSSNLCPDEKGTERHDYLSTTKMLVWVATYAPMKRGLKDIRLHSR